MSLISFSPLQDGVTGVNAAATNTPLQTIYNDYNGNITDANIASSAAIAGSKLADSGITAAKLATSAITLGKITDVTASQTVSTLATNVALTGFSLAVTIPAGGRDVEVVATIPSLTVTGATILTVTLWSGSVGGTQLQNNIIKMQDSGDNKPLHIAFRHTPAAGAITYLLSVATSTNNVTANFAATGPGQLWAKAI